MISGSEGGTAHDVIFSQHEHPNPFRPRAERGFLFPSTHQHRINKEETDRKMAHIPTNILATATICVFSTAKRQEPGDRNQAVKRQTPTATRPAPCARRHQAPRRRAQPPYFEIANGDSCMYNQHFSQHRHTHGRATRIFIESMSFAPEKISKGATPMT